jgi:signal transduction histidine kinase/DNA-binding response OmpR family regulator/HAMP domain-containing protein
MVDSAESSVEAPRRRLSLAPTLTLALVGLTLVLALIAGVGIGSIYSARQSYENSLARAYELEASSSRLLAAGVIEEAAFRRRDRGAPAARREARRAFDFQAGQAAALARGDAASRRLVGARLAAERRARRLSAALRKRRSRSVESRLRAAITGGREITTRLSDRQSGRRADAREVARHDTRSAILVAAAAGLLALAGALALILALIGSIRRPLDSLVSATKKLAGGELSERVEPSGPQELRELDAAFNTMADRLEGAQSRIEAEREKLAVTIESLGDALVVCDAEGVVTAVNPRVAEVAPVLAIGARAHDPTSPLPDLEAALAGEVLVEAEGRTLSITASRLGRDGAGVVWTLRDVSERARLERIKSDFVATASHELRSPLTSIKGFVELLGRSDALGEREREFVDVILQSTDRLVDLVNDLLDVARLEAGRMEVHPRLFDVAELIREVAALMAPRMADKDQRLEVDLPPGLPRALADPVRVRQIVTNLVSNAHQYTGEGGRIAITADGDPEGLELSVRDDGRGMTQQDIDHVFDQFVRRDDGAGGTGLGLSIVRSLVDLQGGSIDVRSRVGEGTTFTVRLPCESEPGDADAPRGAVVGKRVLVADADPGTADLLVEQLRAHGVRAESVRDGDEALARLRSGDFDAMALDLAMDGPAILASLRADEQLRQTPLVLMSTVSGPEVPAGEWQVPKPVDPDALADSLGSAILAGRTRVLVVGRSEVRDRLEPQLVQLGLDHEWVTSGTAAAQACRRRRFELALVDAGIRGPDAVLRGLDLRGRRVAQAVLAFSTGDEGEAPAHLGVRSVAIEDAPEAVMQALATGPANPASKTWERM